MKKNRVVNEESLPLKYQEANQKFRELLSNPPDMKTAEPMDIYYWVKQLVDLTKI